MDVAQAAVIAAIIQVFGNLGSAFIAYRSSDKANRKFSLAVYIVGFVVLVLLCTFAIYGLLSIVETTPCSVEITAPNDDDAPRTPVRVSGRVEPSSNRDVTLIARVWPWEKGKPAHFSELGKPAVRNDGTWQIEVAEIRKESGKSFEVRAFVEVDGTGWNKVDWPKAKARSDDVKLRFPECIVKVTEPVQGGIFGTSGQVRGTASSSCGRLWLISHQPQGTSGFRVETEATVAAEGTWSAQLNLAGQSGTPVELGVVSVIGRVLTAKNYLTDLGLVDANSDMIGVRISEPECIVQIKEPYNGQQVATSWPVTVAVSSTCKSKELWLIVHSEDGGYWVQRNSPQVNGANWSGSAQFGDPGRDMNKRFFLRVCNKPAVPLAPGPISAWPENCEKVSEEVRVRKVMP